LSSNSFEASLSTRCAASSCRSRICVRRMSSLFPGYVLLGDGIPEL
jgi:hypothetical protein